jgi:hypothetical protein
VLNWPPPVPRLLALCRPAAIRRFIVAVIVDALDGMLRTWFAPHVGKEAGIVEPPRADRNASGSIVLVGRAAWRGASTPHRYPSEPFGRSTGLAVRLSVAEFFSTQTSAGASSSTPKVVAESEDRFLTVTDTPPVSMANVFHRDEAAEPLVCDVNEVWHGRSIYS